MNDEHAMQSLQQAHREIARLRAELEAARRMSFMCEAHKFPYGYNDTSGPICSWCERLRVERLERDNAQLAAAFKLAEDKCKEACSGCEPSAGHDYFDEVCGLLRVTRGQRDMAEKEARANRKKG